MPSKYLIKTQLKIVFLLLLSPLVCAGENTGNITANETASIPAQPVPGQKIKKIDFNGVIFRGDFVSGVGNVYTAKEFILRWEFDILIGSDDKISVDVGVNPKAISGYTFAELPFYGRINNLSNLLIGEKEISFTGRLGDGMVTIPDVDVDIQFHESDASFNISRRDFSVVAPAGMKFFISRIPYIGKALVNILPGDSGYSMEIGANSIKSHGKGSVELFSGSSPRGEAAGMVFNFDDNLVITAQKISGEGKAAIYGMEIEGAAYEINKAGTVVINAKKGALAKAKMTIDFRDSDKR
jgi:hypothetical protein